ncbi:MAG: hypothetical protein PHC33_05860 [Candidatus Omnitrophica bacterium]|nr:hypothetical protein [Candidatus Omnitrophota bacterium]
MDDRKLDKLIAAVYGKWKDSRQKEVSTHLDEESLALFLEDKLSFSESDKIRGHAIKCRQCAELIATQVRSSIGEEREFSPALVEKVKNGIVQEMGNYFLEIALKIKGQALEILHTTGDVLVGREFVPAAVLRGRSIKDFHREVIVLKDFKDIRVEIKIESGNGGVFGAILVVREKNTQAVIKDARAVLLKEEAELESYACDSGKVCFEHVPLGAYCVEVVYNGEKSASIVLEITG